MTKYFKLTALLYALTSAVFLTGCVMTDADYRASVPAGTSHLVVKNSGAIAIYETESPQRPFHVLGEVTAYGRSVNLLSSDPTREDVNEALRTEAAKQGGDAVMNVHYTTERTGLASRGKMSATGTVIAYLDPVETKE